MKCKHWKDDDYMIHDYLWFLARLKPRDMCCIACLEKRLNMKIGEGDFKSAIINIPYLSDPKKVGECLANGLESLLLANPNTNIVDLLPLLFMMTEAIL